ncbi:KRAB-A domain-containing protein 2 [Trichonephila clavipes]|nr:KRAB-A domain-containing protein 2 [Trichonephila clavipes]
MRNMRNMWKDIKIVHEKSRHSQTKGSVERANQDMQNMLTAWMKDNDTNKSEQIANIKTEEHLKELPILWKPKNSLKKLSGRERESSTASNKNVTNLTKKFAPAQIGDTIQIQVPDVDRDRKDNRNELAVVVGIVDSKFYKLANENCTLKQLYTRNQFVILHGECRYLPVKSEIRIFSKYLEHTPSNNVNADIHR